MEICSCHHVEIVYTEGNCPLCSAMIFTIWQPIAKIKRTILILVEPMLRLR